MPIERSADTATRQERMAALAREEKTALAALDRATARLGAVRARRDAVVARADEEVAAANAARDAALGVYARAAGPERAAQTLGQDVRDLRRLAREADLPAVTNGETVPSNGGGARPARPRRRVSPGDGSRG